MNSDKLISILSKHSIKKNIVESDSIVIDLELNGDDFDELYFDLIDNYGIDLKKLGHIEKCIHSEGELLDMLFPCKWLLHKIGLRKHRQDEFYSLCS
ncbi:hypothetical protein [Catenovulum maritimum]|uniref:Uncharacterized protein n=1 Tax=Catenovulum maritimum TaxID=1513271 RepID=A0A0J8GW05_9ALTE|nr:hypothetical protein [Catenovulum maritimum]KMT66942.1 hypothetical protein XM47_02245 [Catenovulum maritimum]